MCGGNLRHGLNVLAVVVPNWLRGQVQPDWLERYGHRVEEYRFPSGEEKRQQFLHQVGKDGCDLLQAIQSDPTSQWMLSIPVVDTLQRVWKQDCLPPESGTSTCCHVSPQPSERSKGHISTFRELFKHMCRL
jgi:transposase